MFDSLFEDIWKATSARLGGAPALILHLNSIYSRRLSTRQRLFNGLWHSALMLTLRRRFVVTLILFGYHAFGFAFKAVEHVVYLVKYLIY